MDIHPGYCNAVQHGQELDCKWTDGGLTGWQWHAGLKA